MRKLSPLSTTAYLTTTNIQVTYLTRPGSGSLNEKHASAGIYIYSTLESRSRSPGQRWYRNEASFVHSAFKFFFGDWDFREVFALVKIPIQADPILRPGPPPGQIRYVKPSHPRVPEWGNRQPNDPAESYFKKGHLQDFTHSFPLREQKIYHINPSPIPKSPNVNSILYHDHDKVRKKERRKTNDASPYKKRIEKTREEKKKELT
jgi:hypothetical protein